MSVPTSTQSSRQSSQNFVSNSYRRTSTNPDSDYVPECGIGSCKPQALRFCANMTSFTGYFSICSLLTMSLSSYVTSQVTTLERHFGFSSSETGLIIAANDVGFLIVILFVSHAATKVHIPRALGGATLLFGISGILCALPMFIFGAPSPSLNGTSGSVTPTASAKSFYGQLCQPHSLGGSEPLNDCEVTGLNNGTSSNLARDVSMKSTSQAALAMIVLGMIMQGVAKSPRSSFTTVYVDGNVEKEKTGFYMGIITTITIIGPALAYGLGGVFSRIYVTLQDTDLSPRHPRWIGAWWLGFVFFGSASILFSFPLFLFPRWIKNRHVSDQQKSSQQPTEPNKSSKLVILNVTKEFLSSLKRLLLNPVYDCLVVATCIPMFASSGAASFGPKYMENLFSLPAWKANMATAGILLGTICLGTLVGGWLTKRLKMGPVGALKFVVGVELTALVMSIPLIFLHCPQPLIFNSPGPRAAVDEATIGCFEFCACDDNDFLPVCGSDMRTYYSPCHAGCIISSGSKYSNCSCITGGQAVAGHCDYSCNMLYVYLAFVCLSVLITSLMYMPRLIIFIRSVEDRDKALALGFNSFAMSVTGWMLGPLVFGKVIDLICIQWETTCTGRGSCRLYDNDQLRYQLQGVQLAAKILSLVLTAVALLVAKAKKMYPDGPTESFAELANLVASPSKTQE